MDEFEFIARKLKPLATHPGAMGLEDDAASISPCAGENLVISKDIIAEGTHFFPDDPPGDIARKLLRTNLSDLAAMGAKPVGWLFGLVSDGVHAEPWWDAFVAGMAADIERFGVPLLGGDTITARGGVLCLSATIIGTLPEGSKTTRDGACIGDLVAVSGTIGDAALGLRHRTRQLPGLSPCFTMHIDERYRIPQPRIDLGRNLLNVASAGIDVSDGLAADANHLARCSGISITIELGSLPLSDAARSALEQNAELLDTLLTGGDDYELLVTFPPELHQVATSAANAADTPLTVIGSCTHGAGVVFRDSDGCVRDLTVHGWRHIP